MKTGSLISFFALCATLVSALPLSVSQNIEVGHNVKLRVKKDAGDMYEAVESPGEPETSKPLIGTSPTHRTAELLSIFPASQLDKRQLGVLAGSGAIIDKATAPLASGKNDKFIDLNMPQSGKRSQQSDNI
ncbi:hypothetical protein CERZMDRAFT_92884 [Cercospora zeae-maydis SCOH1-5]|uniref:Uncharacterized protein n=1 Tax=Cercospora zeae-maydis SCOH1-5 TaxID=717836 RepID=A0A6A6FTQ1_9PEZI|nr:hypothetical protein CERZMDRAFT_92884 [Cercospora zeae-maydis SCOH1-5]